ncbi:MAG: bifunctional metallophosphatase/5'-nucleotidase [Bacteroidetes bacterium]|nr:bifunctional metallophosphatase/5'-nucleotidase [Bacteroidota bacterium]
MKKKHLLQFLVGILLIVVLIGGLSAAPAAETSEPVVLQIIETTDLHGSLFPYDFINDREASTSLAQVYTYVEQERAKDQEVILLDNGDMLQGQPIVYYYNFEKTDSEHIQASVMNAMGYDAASVGNHDIEAGHPVYDKIVNEFDFPWLAANALDEETGNPYFEPYTIVEKGGVKVAILGLITPGIPNWLPKDIWEGLFFDDMVKTAEKWVPIIMAKENPDVLVGLFHAGVDYSYSGTADQMYNENASQLVAERVEGFDVIFTGHDHIATNVVVKSPEGNDVYIVGAQSAARTVGSVEIVLDQDMWGHYNIRTVTPENVAIADFPASPAALTAFGYAKQEVVDYVSKKIGTITETISTRDSLWGDNKFVDLIHTLQLDLTSADVSFAAPLSLDASIKEGQVYVRDMFNLYVYENLLYSMDMTGAEIDAFLEYSYAKWYNQMADANDHLINFKKDADGKMILNERYNTYDTVTRYYNYDSAAGIEYTVDVSKPEGDRVDITTMSKDGAAFDMNKHYVVAINSYRGNGGGGHLAAAGLTKEEFTTRVLSSTLADLRFYLIKEFERRGTVVPAVDNNWKILPEAWAKKGAVLDFPLFYK